MQLAHILANYYKYRRFPINTSEYEAYFEVNLALLGLFQTEKVSFSDLEILDCIICGYSYRKTSQILSIDRRQISKRVAEILNLIKDSIQI